MHIYYKPVNSITYWKSPVSIRRGDLCTRINNEYRRYMMKDVRNYSDLPYSEDPKVSLCDLIDKVRVSTYTCEFV